MHSDRSLQTHYLQLGEGPPLLILHGLFGSGTNWRSIAHRLSDCREIFLPDARNHGASEHVHCMDYPAMAQDTVNFMDQQGLAAVDVIGHSMGGKTAMHLALGHPERVRSLMIVDIAPVASPSDHLPLMDAMQALPLAQLSDRRAADQALATTVTEAGLRAFLLQNLISRDNTFNWRLNLSAIRASMPELLKFPQPAEGAVYTGPVEFIRGELSDYINDEHDTVIKNYFPSSHTHLLVGAGHWPHAEQPAAFITRCRDFLKCPAP